MNDQELHTQQKGLQQGNHEVLAGLFEQQRERLERVAHFRMDPRLSKRLQPSDVVQEAYLAASKRLKSYTPETCGSPFVWLRLILNQTMIDLHRHHLGTKMRDAHIEVGAASLVHPQASSFSIAAHIFGCTSSPSRIVMQMDMVDRARTAITELSSLDQEIIAMRHFEELSNKETAEILGIEQKASSIRYFRALKRLRELLSQFSVFQEKVCDA
ncbi:MAG: sigma-70 family RNA polymerase sigma factor [Desulfobacterales bacterium]|nr:sigma-70 family RNA polymerase sigma factor [Desulfobacterales bacterium]